MINPKHICIAAGVGFVLSFLIGIFSGIGILLVLIRALICAAIFAAVGTGGSILYQMFLSDGQTESVSDTPVEKVSRAGGVVDITIGDENLLEDEQGPRFNVGRTRSALKAAEMVSAGMRTFTPPPQAKPAAFEQAVPEPVQPVAQESAAPVADSEVQPAFQPMNLVAATTASEHMSPEAESAPEPVSAAQPVSPVAASPSDDLEELPDIGAFAGDDEEDGGVNDVVSDSEFATEDVPRPSRSSSGGGSFTTDQSAQVMAQAIRTILTKN